MLPIQSNQCINYLILRRGEISNLLLGLKSLWRCTLFLWSCYSNIFFSSSLPWFEKFTSSPVLRSDALRQQAYKLHNYESLCSENQNCKGQQTKIKTLNNISWVQTKLFYLMKSTVIVKVHNYDRNWGIRYSYDYIRLNLLLGSFCLVSLIFSKLSLFSLPHSHPPLDTHYVALHIKSSSSPNISQSHIHKLWNRDLDSIR